MYQKFVIALVGATTLAGTATLVTGAGAAGRTTARPAVTIRVEGSKKTLVLPESARGETGWITKGGAPKGQCSGWTAQGVLDRATHGRWQGTWYPSYHEYLVTSILGEKPSGSDYWTFFINDKTAAHGACDTKLKQGERLLFAVTNGKEYPSELFAPRKVRAGRPFTVKLLGYAAKGQSKPLAGVVISGKGVTPGTTNHRGMATLTAVKTGRTFLRATPSGQIRSEAAVRVVKS